MILISPAIKSRADLLSTELWEEEGVEKQEVIPLVSVDQYERNAAFLPSLGSRCFNLC